MEEQYEDEELELPRFDCRLPIPDEITGGSRMLLQQVDILRQEIAYVFKRTVTGRRALRISVANAKEIENGKKLYYMVLGVVVFVQVLIFLYSMFHK